MKFQDDISNLHTYIHTHGQAETNFFKVGDIIKLYVFGHFDAYAMLFYINLRILQMYINRILNITLYFILGFQIFSIYSNELQSKMLQINKTFMNVRI